MLICDKIAKKGQNGRSLSSKVPDLKKVHHRQLWRLWLIWAMVMSFLGRIWVLAKSTQTREANKGSQYCDILCRIFISIVDLRYSFLLAPKELLDYLRLMITIHPSHPHLKQQGSLLFSKFEFSIKPDLRDLSFLCIRWPYAVFYKMQIVFYKSTHFMYLWGINSVFAKCALKSSKILK